jgi:hypothetical protein
MSRFERRRSVRQLPNVLVLVLFLTGLLVNIRDAKAQEASFAKWMPETTVFYGEVRDVPKLIKQLLEHPLRAKIESFPDVQQALKGDDFQRLVDVIELIETQIDMEWEEAIEAIADDGLAVGIDVETNGVVMIGKASKPDVQKKIVETIVKLAKLDAKQNGNSSKFAEKDYRGIKAYQIDKAIIAMSEGRLMITNKSDLAKEIADSMLDDSKDVLANVDQFQKAQATKIEDSPIWTYVDLRTLRKAGVASELFDKKLANIGAEFLVGGLLSNLEHADFAVIGGYLDDKQISVTATTPHQADWVSKSREYFFGPAGKGGAPIGLKPDNLLVDITTHRDLSGLWLNKEELFDERHLAELTQADSQLTTFFSGLNFGEELLASVEPQIQFVATRQDFSAHGSYAPTLRLPAFAFVFQLKDRAKVERKLRVGFQSAIGFANIGLSTQGMPALETQREKLKNGYIISAEYLPLDEEGSGAEMMKENKKADKEEKDGDRSESDSEQDSDDNAEETDPAESDPGNGLIHYNFSPSLGFVDDYLILSSTAGLAQELAAAATNGKHEKDEGVNTRVFIDGRVLLEILNENREALVAQNMLENGHSREKAEGELGILFSILETLKDGAMTLKNTDDSLSLKIAIGFDSK